MEVDKRRYIDSEKSLKLCACSCSSLSLICDFAKCWTESKHNAASQIGYYSNTTVVSNQTRLVCTYWKSQLQHVIVAWQNILWLLYSTDIEVKVLPIPVSCYM